MSTGTFSTPTGTGGAIERTINPPDSERWQPPQDPWGKRSRAYDQDRALGQDLKLSIEGKQAISGLLKQIEACLLRAREEVADDRHLRQEHIEDASQLWAKCFERRAALRKYARAFLASLLPCLSAPVLLTADDPCSELSLVIAEFAGNIDADDKDVSLWLKRLEECGLDPSWACTTPPEGTK